jgi:hypothetical protein
MVASGYNAANAAVGQIEDQMVEATIGTLANLETATATDPGVVATLTEANARLAKKLEDTASELRDLKALLKKERTERRGQRTFNPSPHSYYWTRGYRVANTHTSLSWNFPKQGHKWEATRADNMGGSQANKEWCEGAATLNNNTPFEDCRTPPLLKQHETSIVESGCTGHFLLINAPCKNKSKSENPLTVRFPNGATMDSTHSNIDIPELNRTASFLITPPAWWATHYCQVENFAMKATLLHLRLTQSQFTTRMTSKSYGAREIWTQDFGVSICNRNTNNIHLK